MVQLPFGYRWNKESFPLYDINSNEYISLLVITEVFEILFSSCYLYDHFLTFYKTILKTMEIYMKNLFALIALISTLSLSVLTPAFADDAKAEETKTETKTEEAATTTEAKSADATKDEAADVKKEETKSDDKADSDGKDKADSDGKKEEKKKSKDDEEPDCD